MVDAMDVAGMVYAVAEWHDLIEELILSYANVVILMDGLKGR